MIHTDGLSLTEGTGWLWEIKMIKIICKAGYIFNARASSGIRKLSCTASELMLNEIARIKQYPPYHFS